ncbi:MAG: response regulator [Promethearchaeota archaeon]
MGSHPNSEYKSDILIVDDEEGMRETLCELLRLKGYQAETAKDGYEAVERISDLKPRIVILDIRMPGMNGVETLRKLKKIMPNLTFIMMTGYSVQHLGREALREGAITIIEKPFSIVKLINIIKSVKK